MDSEERSSRRGVREKKCHSGRFEALGKLKALKNRGEKHKYEVTQPDNVYEEVSESEYTDTVLRRQNDQWIVHDGDASAEGYVEDGREIFDDDLDTESIEKESRGRKQGGNKRRARDEDSGVSKDGANIKRMLANMATAPSAAANKRKRTQVKLEEDDVLGNLIKELDGQGSDDNSSSEMRAPSSTIMPFSSKRNKIEEENLEARQYLQSSFSTMKSVKVTEKIAKVDRNEIAVEENVTISPSERFKLKDDDDEFLVQFQHEDLSQYTSGQNIQPKKMEVNNEKKSSACSETPKEDVDLKNDEKDVVALQKKEEMEMCVNINLDEWNISSVKNKGKVFEHGEEEVDDKWMTGTEVDQDQESFVFYYLDAYEDINSRPGTVFLFGKVRQNPPPSASTSSSFVSCCLIVRNIPRCVYLLPRKYHSNNGRNDNVEGDETGENVRMLDVYNEFNKVISERYKIMQFKSRKVTKNYAFEVSDVPDVCDYLEIRYPANYCALPSTLSGQTFSRIFGGGGSSSFLETFLLERQIKGPCWLRVQNPNMVSSGTTQLSWCKVEVICDDMCDVKLWNEGRGEGKQQLKQQQPPPPLVVLALNMRFIASANEPLQLTLVSCFLHNVFPLHKAAPKPTYQQHFCAFTKPTKLSWPYDLNEMMQNFEKNGDVGKAEKMDCERSLLSFVLAKIQLLDPDVIVGHDICGLQLATLVQRLAANKIPHWSRIGRLRRTNLPNASSSKGKNFLDRNVLCGRLLCDTQISAKELIKARSYQLHDLAQQILQVNNEMDIVDELSAEQIKQMYMSGQSLMKLIKMTTRDANLTLSIMCQLNVLPLALQITNIAGNVLSRTLMGGRSERNEFLLLHAFHANNYILPDKYRPQAVPNKGKRKAGNAQYEGGLVLEPKKGFYDKLILLMDFNSLYPSIIQEYNICFTTISIRAFQQDLPEEEIMSSLLNELSVMGSSGNEQPGILPSEIRKLVESRKQVKQLISKSDDDPALKHQLDMRQMALKLTANSMYGCLGFANSRFFAKPLAALVTAKGREILLNTRDLVNKLNLEVIYGDTDSLMINTNSLDYEQVFKMALKIKAEVNKLYKRIELDVDGVFKYMLLLKKKKYAAVSITKSVKANNGTNTYILKQEIKGLDVVRRDWSQLSAEAGKYALNQILSDQSLEEKLENIRCNLEKLANDLRSGLVPLSLLTITKQLTKHPDQYPDKKAQPHVQVAIRLNKNPNFTRKFKQGDTVAYIICLDGTNNGAMQRAYHVEEVKSRRLQSEKTGEKKDDPREDGNLEVDVEYYLTQQILPVVGRLCEPIESFDLVHIAEALGLDSSSYRRHETGTVGTIANDDEDGSEVLVFDDVVEKYKNCRRFEFKCMDENCGALNIIEDVFTKEEGSIPRLSLERCSNSSCSIAPFSYLIFLQNKLVQAIRFDIQRYYQNWMVCEESSCGNRSRILSQRSAGVKKSNNKWKTMCQICQNQLRREYSELELYTQLCYYEHIFDIGAAMNRDKRIKLHHDSPLYNAYAKLRHLVQSYALASSAYNVVDLARIARNILLLK